MASAACLWSGWIGCYQSQEITGQGCPCESKRLDAPPHQLGRRLRGYSSDNQRGPEEQSHDSFYAPIAATPSVK